MFDDHGLYTPASILWSLEKQSTDVFGPADFSPYFSTQPAHEIPGMKLKQWWHLFSRWPCLMRVY